MDIVVSAKNKHSFYHNMDAITILCSVYTVRTLQPNINYAKVLYMCIVAEFMQLQAVVIRYPHRMGMNTLHQEF